MVVRVEAAGAHQADLHTKRFDGMGAEVASPSASDESARATRGFSRKFRKFWKKRPLQKDARRGEEGESCFCRATRFFFFFRGGQNLRLGVLSISACVVTPEIYTQHFGFLNFVFRDRSIPNKACVTPEIYTAPQHFFLPCDRQTLENLTFVRTRGRPLSFARPAGARAGSLRGEWAV